MRRAGPPALGLPHTGQRALRRWQDSGDWRARVMASPIRAAVTIHAPHWTLMPAHVAWERTVSQSCHRRGQLHAGRGSHRQVVPWTRACLVERDEIVDDEFGGMNG